MRVIGWFFGSVLGVVVLVALCIGLSLAGLFISGEISKATANYRGDVAVKEQTRADPNYRIAAYEHYYDLCASVQTREQAIKSIKAQLDGPSGTESRKEQLQASLTANQVERAELINQYNADAHKSYTKAQFLASDLPFQLDVNAQETTCTV